jgi:integrase
MPRRKCPGAHKHGDIWHYPDRDKQWRAVFYVKGRPDWHSFYTEDECQAWYAAERAHRHKTGRPTPARQFAGRAVGDVVRAHLQRLEKKIEDYPDVIENVSNRDYLQSFLDKEPGLCSKRATDLTRRDVKEFIGRRSQTEYAGPASKPWKSKTTLPVLNSLKREVAPLRVAFGFLEDESDDYVNPWKECFSRIEHYIGSIAVSSREGRPLEYGEFGKLLAFCNDNNWSRRFLVIAIYIGFIIGMRKGEILNLRAADIDHDKARIHVRKEKIDKKGRARGEEAGRTIAMPDFLSDVLLQLEDLAASDVTIGPKNGDDKIFSYRRRPWTAEAFGQAFKSLTAKAKVDNFTVHGFRHTARNRTSHIFSEAETCWMYGWLPGKKTMANHYAAKPTDDDLDNMKMKLDMLAVRMSGNLKDWSLEEFTRRLENNKTLLNGDDSLLEYIKRRYAMTEPERQQCGRTAVP